MASTKIQKPQSNSGITKAGRNSKSGGRNRGKNGVMHQHTVLYVPSRADEAKERRRIAQQQRLAAREATVEALEGKLTTKKSQPILEVATFMLDMMVGLKTAFDPDTKKPMSAHVATERHFTALGFTPASIKVGLQAARLELNYQHKMVIESGQTV